MRILFAAQSYRPATNGAAVFAINLAEGLARSGHEVAVLTPSDRGRAYAAWCGGVRVQRLRAIPLAPLYPEIHVTLFAGRQVAALLDAFRPQVVHLHDHYPLSRAALAAARSRRLPLVGTNNFLPENLLPQMPLLAGGGVLAERLLWRLALSVFDRVEVVTAATETAAGIFRRAGLRRPAQAISCGVDLERFRPDPAIDRAATRRRYGLDPQRALFLYLGRLDPDKRIDLLLRALHLLPQQDLQLAVAGRGRALAALQALAGRLALGERVVFAGYVPDEDLPALLNSVDVFVMPSAVELQCLAALEAMGTGRPVLAAEAGALPELVANGVNGYLFRAGDVEDAARRLAQLLAEREAWPAMGAASLARAEPHSIAHTVRRYEELYRALLNS